MKLPHIKHEVDRLRADAADVLEPGEDFVAAVPIERIGRLALMDAGMVGGLVGQGISKYEEKRDASHLVDLPLAEISFGMCGVIVAATDRRILAFARGATGKAGDLLGAWPLEGTTVESSVHFAGQGARVRSLRFVLPDHTLLAGECDAIAHHKSAQQLEDALHHAA